MTDIRAAESRVPTGEPVERLRAALVPLGLLIRPDDEWLPEELAMVHGALADLRRAARWSPATCTRALGGVITVVRDRTGPITTDAAGTRYPVQGLYDADKRTLTVNDWSFDARTGGEPGGRRAFVHELAHAWDRRSRHRLSWGMSWLPGPRASSYARVSRFEDWADAVMGAVYGADNGFEAFDRSPSGRISPRLRYVRWAFVWYR